MRKILASLLLTSILAVSVSAGQTDVPPGQTDVPPSATGQIDVPPSPDEAQQESSSSTDSISGLLLYLLLGISWSG